MGTYVEVDMYGLPADTIRQEETENRKIKEKEEMKLE